MTLTELEKNNILSSFKKIIYINEISSWYPNPLIDIEKASNNGFNIIILYQCNNYGPNNILKAWENSSLEQQFNCLNLVHKNNGAILISCENIENIPYNCSLNSINGIEYGNLIINFIKKYNLDGIDFNFNNINQNFISNNCTSFGLINWIGNACSTIKNLLEKHIILCISAPA